MALYLCDYNKEELTLNVHKDITWLDPKDILTLDWAGADIPVAKKIYETFVK